MHSQILSHGCHCNINASFGMRRRNEIQRVLKDYTKKYLGLPERAVHLEAFAGTTAGTDLVAPTRVTADISFIVGVDMLWIDVSVVDPGCDHYIQRYRSNEVPDAAAKAMETLKRSHYSPVKDLLPLPLPLPPAPASIISFVLETSGRLGPSALGFIQRISDTHTYLKSQCAVSSGRMLEATRERMRANPHKWLT